MDCFLLTRTLLCCSSLRDILVSGEMESGSKDHVEKWMIEGSLMESTPTTDVTFRSLIYLQAGCVGMWFYKTRNKQQTCTVNCNIADFNITDFTRSVNKHKYNQGYLTLHTHSSDSNINMETWKYSHLYINKHSLVNGRTPSHINSAVEMNRKTLWLN